MALSLKSVIVAGMIALSCNVNSLAASTVDSLVNEVVQNSGFYTLYLGMPSADFKANWGNVSGWKRIPHPKEAEQYEYASPIAYETFEREHKINGKDVTESVLVIVSKKLGTVWAFSCNFISYDKQIADEFFDKMYSKTLQIYPDLHEGPRQIGFSLPSRVAFEKAIENNGGTIRLHASDRREAVDKEGAKDYRIRYEIGVSYQSSADVR